MMPSNSLPIVEIKNQWLFDHVNVEYPTKESLAGKTLYQQSVSQSTYQLWQQDELQPQPIFNEKEIYLVDFHRLTVMFSLLQASNWEDEKHKADVLEFFTQIILSAPCDLYVAFLDGHPTAAAIVTQLDGELLISDIVCQAQANRENEKLKKAFTSQLITLVSDSNFKSQVVYIESK